MSPLPGRTGASRRSSRAPSWTTATPCRTWRTGRAQLRFTDGAYVSLQPQSEFAIRDYRFDGKTDGTERGFFGLLKGAMRTVSGPRRPSQPATSTRSPRPRPRSESAAPAA
jgi:hypothetical protein